MNPEPERSDRPILVTGAAGKTGLAVIRALAARGARVRALVRRKAQSAAVTAAGAAEILVADQADPGAMEEAFDGAAAVYYICPNLRSNETELGRLAIDVARAAGLGHFVYHSVLHPHAERMPHHWQKLRVEEALFESGLAWTILQPAAYMQNLLAGWSEVVERGVYRMPYGVASRIALVALEDVAEVAARAITEEGHVHAIYELVGTAPLAQTEVAALLAEALGRPVEAVETPAIEARTALEARGLDRYQVSTLMKMFDYYGEHGLEGSTRVLAWLLGRAPTTLAEFVHRQARDGGS